MINENKNYIYPMLPAVKCTPFIRIGGSGLANCMFVAARAFVYSKLYKLDFIEPTWFNLSIGTYIRNQSDKRHYLGLFNDYSSNFGWRKFFILSLYKKKSIADYDSQSRKTIYVTEGLGNYFEDLIEHHQDINLFFTKIIKTEILKKVNGFNFEGCVAVHIRLGDYNAELRTSLEWYVKVLEEINKINDNLNFLIFSDGNDEELSDILRIPNTKRVYFDNAIGDIWAMSKTLFLVGSDSTFSGWGAFLGQVPSLFAKKHFGRILRDDRKEYVSNEIDQQTLEMLKENLCLINT